MRIVPWITVLLTVVTRVRCYGSGWHVLHQNSETASLKRPVETMTDVVNDLGIKVLEEYGENRNFGNIAFSPTGIGFVLAALWEGSAGPGHRQIAGVLGLPADKDITRIGLRDIHRRLRSYLSPDGFLGGLTLNRENTKLCPDYEDVLKFLGFDLSSVNEVSNSSDSSFAIPDSVPEVENISPDPPPSTTTFESEPTTILSTKVTSNTEVEGMSQSLTLGASTEAMSTVSTEKTTSIERTDPTTTTIQEISTKFTDLEISTTTKLPTIIEQRFPEIETTSLETPEITETTDNPSTPPIPISVTESSSESSEELDSYEMPMTTPRSVDTTTSDSVLSTLKPQETTTIEQISSANPEEPPTSLATPTITTTTTEIEPNTTIEPVGSTSKVEETTTSQLMEGKPIVQSTPASEMSTTTVKGIDDSDVSTLQPDYVNEEGQISTTFDPMGIEISVTSGNQPDQMTTLSPEEVSTKKQEMSDESMTEEASTSQSAETATNEVDYESTTMIANQGTTVAPEMIPTTVASEPPAPKESKVEMGTRKRRKLRSVEVEDRVVRTLLESRLFRIRDDRKIRSVRSHGNYFPNYSYLPEFPSFPVHPYYESSWNHKAPAWSQSSNNAEPLRDVTELNFFVNGVEPTSVPAATYTVVLPFAFLPTLEALALEFPLDDPRYNILLLLPTDISGTRRLTRAMTTVSLREVRKELQPAWVRATIPSFMLKGFVTLTGVLQRLGIRDVFEPRSADLSPMTCDVGVYARDVQQSIGVNIRNYMKPDRTHSRNGLFERAGPVSFVAEHPFLFFIIDAETGVSLIAGRIDDPLNSRIL